jgi:hypothetical protein
MAKKAKGFGTNLHVKTNRRKRPGRHSKKHKGKKRLWTGTRFSYIRNNMFYIWHTLLIALFISIGFVLGYKLGNKKTKIEEPKGKCPFGFDQEN